MFITCLFLPKNLMKVTIILTGKTEEPYVEEGMKKYLGRLQHYLKTEVVVLPPVKNRASLQQEQLREREGEIILAKIKPTDYVILLDERGKQLSSTELASYLYGLINNSVQNLCIVVGGAFGVSGEVRARADMVLSLSKMTFSHQMVRLFLAEQLYRAMTIIKGEKYHHD